MKAFVLSCILDIFAPPAPRVGRGNGMNREVRDHPRAAVIAPARTAGDDDRSNTANQARGRHWSGDHRDDVARPEGRPGTRE